MDLFRASDRPHFRTWQAGLLMVACISAPFVGASAQEYCVACTGPVAVYRCAIDQAVPTGMPLKMLCVSTMAREGGHATCAVRGGTVFDCNGPVKRIDAKAAGQALNGPATTAASTMTSQPASGSSDAQPEGQAPAIQVKGPPKTVEELAKRMTKSSGESLGKAGSTIADTTTKAWECLKSFFKAC